jgi:hydrogenase maturation protease
MVLVIGYGNLLRGDDGIGQILANGLDERIRHPSVKFVACHQLTPELAEPISRAATVIFIDAYEGEEAGFLTSYEVMPTRDDGAFTHQATPATLLAAARSLYGKNPRSMMVCVEGESFEFGDTLSPSMEMKLPGLLNTLQQVIDLQISIETGDRMQ